MVIINIYSSIAKIAHILMKSYRRNLTQTEQLEYIDAIKCMISKPAKTGDVHAGAKSHFDDFQALHIDQTDYIHWCVST